MTTRNFVENKYNWQILSKNGFIPFCGISTMGYKDVYRIKFDDDSIIEASANHVFFSGETEEIQTNQIKPGQVLFGVPNDKIVTDITHSGYKQTYDIIESENHTFLTNGIVSHNCKFLSSDALLFNTKVLANRSPEIEKVKPTHIVREVKFWKEIKNQHTYLVGVDPATGSGSDYTVITVFEFPSLIQVAEYRSNTMSPNEMYEVLKNILKYLEKQDTMVYFSIENNGVGEGLISLYEQDEEPPENAEMVSEEGSNRRGMTTTSKVKMKACVNFKEMWEREQMTINSRILLQEMKQFVRHRGAYAAQHGSTDDCISAVLIVVRLVEEIASYDDEAFQKLYSGEYNEWDEWGMPLSETDENDAPLPMSM